MQSFNSPMHSFISPNFDISHFPVIILHVHLRRMFISYMLESVSILSSSNCFTFMVDCEACNITNDFLHFCCKDNSRWLTRKD